MYYFIIMGTLALFCLGVGPAAGECKKHIELHSSKYYSKVYGRSEMWVLGNVKIHLWQHPTTKGKGRKVGGMRIGSRAVILQEGKEDYKIISPLDKSVGWVNKMQVRHTLKQDDKTFKPCK